MFKSSQIKQQDFGESGKKIAEMVSAKVTDDHMYGIFKKFMCLAYQNPA
jgi:hypothetical protein